MLKRILQFGLIAVLIGSAVGYYMWNKPHEAIGKPDVFITASELATEFDTDENEAMKK